MKKLTPQNKLYLSILYVIWELLMYYENLFGLKVPSNATRLSAGIMVDEDNVTHIIVDLPCTVPVSLYYDSSAMKTILNEYLNIVLLPSCKELEPFSGGQSYLDMMDCLYIYNANCLSNGYCNIDIIYVDNMQAYKKVRADKNIKM